MPNGSREPFTLLNDPGSVSQERAIEVFKARVRKVEDVVKDRRPVGWLVDGLLPLGQVYLCGGDPKLAAKSLLAMQLCKSVTTGTPFLGRKTVQGNTIYCNFEDGTSVIGQRLYDFGVRDDIAPSNRARAYVHEDRETLPFVLATILNAPYGTFALCVIDTLTHAEAVFGITDENHPGQMTALGSMLAHVARVSGCTILVNHHNRKDGLMMRGSTALLASVDGWLEIVPGEKGLRKLSALGKCGASCEIGVKIEFPTPGLGGVISVADVDAETVEVKVRGKDRRGRKPALTDARLEELCQAYVLGLPTGESVSARRVKSALESQLKVPLAEKRVLAALKELAFEVHVLQYVGRKFSKAE